MSKLKDLHIVKELDERYVIVLGYAASEDAECVYDNEEEARRQNGGKMPLVGFVIFDKTTNNWAEFAQEWFEEYDIAIAAYKNAMESRPVLRLDDNLALVLLPVDEDDLEMVSESFVFGFYSLADKKFAYAQFATCAEALVFYRNVILSSDEDARDKDEEDGEWVISDFNGTYAYLSNGYDQANCPIPFAGLQFRTAEGAFQSQKCPEQAHLFTNLTAKEAKRLGNNLPLRPDWNDVRDQVMYNVLNAKFSQTQVMRNRLLITGDAKIEPHNLRHDNYWGSCQCAECAGKAKQNKLGVILMNIRDSLRMLQN